MKILGIILGFAFAVSSHAGTLTLNYQGNTKQCTFNYTQQTVSSYSGEFGEGCPGYVPPLPPAGDCKEVVPPPGFTRNLVYTTFQSVWGPFPGKYGNKTFKFGQYQYVTLELIVPESMATDKYGRFSIISTGTSNPMSLTITECSSDFRTVQKQGCAVSNANETNVNYITNHPTSLKCNLTPGRKYYLNIIGAPLGTTQSKCGTSGCSVTIGNYPPS